MEMLRGLRCVGPSGQHGGGKAQSCKAFQQRALCSETQERSSREGPLEQGSEGQAGVHQEKKSGKSFSEQVNASVQAAEPVAEVQAV